MDTEEDIHSLDRQWEKLDVAIQNRENLLETALDKFEKMNRTYDRVCKENKILNENITQIQDQLNNVTILCILLEKNLILFKNINLSSLLTV